jgi:hypothetical protein
MAVAYKQEYMQVPLVDICMLFSLPPDIIKVILTSHLGITLWHKPPKTYYFQTALGSVSYFEILPSAISMAKNHHLGPASLACIRQEILTALKVLGIPAKEPVSHSIKEQSHDFMLSFVEETLPQKLDTAPLGIKMPEANDVPVPPPAGFWTADQFSMEDTSMKSTVHLRDATELYQPVFGTSSESTYHVVALLDGLNIGVIAKGKCITFRAEGSNLKVFSGKLEGVGFEKKTENHMSFSLCFDDTNVFKANAVIGTIIGAVGFDKLRKVGSLNKAGVPWA